MLQLQYLRDSKQELIDERNNLEAEGLHANPQRQAVISLHIHKINDCLTSIDQEIEDLLQTEQEEA